MDRYLIPAAKTCGQCYNKVMCGRYTLGNIVLDTAWVRERWEVDEIVPVRPSFNVSPSQSVPVVVQDGEHRLLTLMQWGFQPGWLSPSAGKPPPINARSETLLERPLWRGAAQRARCLIPADGFYEWRQAKGSRGKQPVYIRLKSKQPFAFAGLYTAMRDGGQSCAIVTCGPNELMAPIHHRMPVILEREDEARWLDPAVVDPAHVLPCLRPYPAALMEAYPVSSLVSSPQNNDPSLIQPQLLPT